MCNAVAAPSENGAHTRAVLLRQKANNVEHIEKVAAEFHGVELIRRLKRRVRDAEFLHIVYQKTNQFHIIHLII